MKRLLLRIVLFFVAVSVIDISVGFAGDYLQKHAKGGITKAFNDLVMTDNHDILVFGSSRALHHYDTPYLSDMLGMDVYNAGKKGNGIVLAKGMIEMILKHSNPQLIVFDVEPAFDIYVSEEDDHNKRYLALLKPYFRIPEVERIFRDVSDEEWLEVHSGMFRYNTSIITKAFDNVTDRKQSRYGYEPLSGICQSEEAAVIDAQKPLDSFKLKYIEQLIILAQEHNIPLVFIASPKYGCTDSSELEPVKAICERYRTPFIDYYSSPEFNQHREWFQEAVHLNSNGARHFSAIIGNEISILL